MLIYQLPPIKELIIIDNPIAQIMHFLENRCRSRIIEIELSCWKQSRLLILVPIALEKLLL